MLKTITISNDIDLELKIRRVFVERCCGTWCVKVEDFSGSTMRIAAIESDYSQPGAREAAEKYANQVAEAIGVEVEMED